MIMKYGIKKMYDSVPMWYHLLFKIILAIVNGAFIYKINNVTIEYYRCARYVVMAFIAITGEIFLTTYLLYLLIFLIGKKKVEFHAIYKVVSYYVIIEQIITLFINLFLGYPHNSIVISFLIVFTREYFIIVTCLNYIKEKWENISKRCYFAILLYLGMTLFQILGVYLLKNI